MAILFTLTILFTTGLALLNSNRIFFGVSTPLVHVSSLTTTEAEAKLQTYFQEKIVPAPVIKIDCNNKSWSITADQIDLELDSAATAQKAFSIGRNPNIFKRIYEQIQCFSSGIIIEPEFRCNKTKLTAVLKKVHTQSGQDTEDAYCQLDGEKVTIIPEKIGQKPNFDKLMNDCSLDALKKQLPLIVHLDVEISSPQVTADALKQIDTLLTEYSSQFNAENENRSENIRIAAKSIDKHCIVSGEIFSFNEHVGLRVAEAGFKEAPVLINGKSVPDIGGGVCQVSSTLYNAILLADLKPMNRTPHFHPLGYVPFGLDATVADNLIDFTFQNTLPNSIYLLTKVANNTLTIYILGNHQSLSKETISLASSIDKVIPPAVVEQTDPSLSKGARFIADPGQEGYVVSSYRIKSYQGQEVSRELLYVDTYSAEDKIIRIGTGK